MNCKVCLYRRYFSREELLGNGVCFADTQTPPNKQSSSLRTHKTMSRACVAVLLCVSVDVTTAFLSLPTADPPPTLVPGMTYICQEHTDMNDTAGKVSFVNSMESDIACWHIACDKDVFVTFSTLALDTAILYLYSSSNGVDYTLQKRFTSLDPFPEDMIALSGSVYVQFQALSPATMSTVDLDYVCRNPTPQPTTDAPPTLVPGVTYMCQEYTELDPAGKVSYATSSDVYDTACWHIECDKSVVVTMTAMSFYSPCYLKLYNSTNGVDYTVAKELIQLPTSLVVLTGSAILQFRGPGVQQSTFSLSYVCMDPPPLPPTDAPPTLVPGISYPCEEHTDLNDTAGKVTYASRAHDTPCWHVECDTGVVITILSLALGSSSFLGLYNSSNGVDYTLMREFDDSNPIPGPIVLSGSVYVLFRKNFDTQYAATFELDYLCMGATAQPPTRVPGLSYPCDDHTDLNHTAGNVSYSINSTSVECWHIECDKDLVMSFFNIQLGSRPHSLVGLYSSSNGVDYAAQDFYGTGDTTGDNPAVVKGSAYVQLNCDPDTQEYGCSFNFDYVCVDPTPAPATDAPPTLAPGLNHICQKHTDLNDTAGTVTYAGQGSKYNYQECWHIECDKEVVITFSYLDIGFPYGDLDLYSSGNGTYTIAYRFHFGNHVSGPLVLTGPAYVQLLPDQNAVTDFSFDYVCVDVTPQPTTDAPPTRAPGLQSICDDYTDLNDTVGNVSFPNNSRSESTRAVTCWHIECDKAVVMSFSNIQINIPSYVLLSSSSNGVDYVPGVGYNYDNHNPDPVVLKGSAYMVQMICQSPGCSFNFDYVCVDPTPAPATDAPPTLAPGLDRLCLKHTDLNDTAGTATYAGRVHDNTPACWHIECDTEVVVTFSYLHLGSNVDLYLYSSSNNPSNDTYTLNYDLNSNTPVSGPLVLTGPAYVQLLPSAYYITNFSFDYACTDTTAAPTVAPGLDHICTKHTDLNDTAGNVTHAGQGSEYNDQECWHIECDKEVVITFSYLDIRNGMTVLRLYSSSNDTYTLEYRFTSADKHVSGPLMLTGPAYVQLLPDFYDITDFSFNYMCVDSTPAPATDVPPTLAPGVQYICEYHTDLNDTAGNVTYANDALVECWHIECDKSVVITFRSFGLQYSDLYLYNTSDGVDYSLDTILRYYDGLPEAPIVLHGSALLQLSNPHGRTSTFELDYACMSVTPQPTTEAPPTLAPGAAYMCQEHTDLNDTGKVDFVNSMAINVECWYIECDKSVMITFTTLSLENRAFLELFSSESGNGTHYTLERIISHPDNTGVGFVLNGSALVQFVQMNDVFSENDASKVGFNYMCMGGSPQPATEAPPTLAPGVEYICHDHTDLNDTSGKVTYVNHEANNTACWYIECDKSVAITFSDMEVYAQSLLYLYSSGSTSGSATHYTLEKVLFSSASTGDQLMLDGSALVQFRSGTHAGRSALDFEYVCQSADKDDSGHPTWPYVVFPVVGVVSLALGVVALLKSGVFKAKMSKYSLKDGVNNDERASLL